MNVIRTYVTVPQKHASIVRGYRSGKASKSFVCRLTMLKFSRTYEFRCPKYNEWYEEYLGEGVAHRAGSHYYYKRFWVLVREEDHEPN